VVVRKRNLVVDLADKIERDSDGLIVMAMAACMSCAPVAMDSSFFLARRIIQFKMRVERKKLMRPQN